MQNKTITFRLKKHLNRSKGCCCVFFAHPVSSLPRSSLLFFSSSPPPFPRPSLFTYNIIYIYIYIISLTVPLSAVYMYVCMYACIKYTRIYTYITWLSTVTPFIQNTWAKRLLFFIILYTRTYTYNNNNVTRGPVYIYIYVRAQWKGRRYPVYLLEWKSHSTKFINIQGRIKEAVCIRCFVKMTRGGGGRGEKFVPRWKKKI